MTKKKQATRAVLKAVRAGSISTELEARRIARRFLPGAMSFEITGAISDALPRIPKEIVHRSKLNHPWFRKHVIRTVYEDTWGRVWNKATGIVRRSIKLVVMPKKYGGSIWIDRLGGMSWHSADKKHFVCEFRTSREEFFKSRISPETFIG